ncbi:MAG: hypothetical protein P8L79_12025 [Rhodospirillaceae bacterium]|nr:hypothetical protein [Rhodospirillaceae bacterium]
MGDRKAVEAETEYVKDLPGFDRTQPQFFKDPMIDKLLEIVLLLGGEIWTNRDRQMVMEHLLATEGVVTPDLIETFKPDEEFEHSAEDLRLKFVNRIYGCLYDDTEIPEDQNHFKWLTDKKKDQDAA